MPAWLLPAIAGAVSLGSSVIGSETANANSQANIEYQTAENERNRQFALDMWNRTNEYNTPLMQMQRFKVAGLNPHLIYGQGTHGNAQMASTPMGKAPVSTRQAPDFGTAIMDYVSTRKQQTEIDNLEKAKEVMDADINSKNAAAAASLSNSAKTEQDRDHASQLFGTVAQQAEANLQSTKVSTQKAVHEIDNLVDNLKTSSQQREAIRQTMRESAARIKNLQVDNNLKGIQAEIDSAKARLWRQGINPESSAYERLLKGLLDASGFNDFLESLREKGFLRTLIE